MNKRKKYSKDALDCVLQMSQAGAPTREQFIAAWNEGLIDTTQEGVRIILETMYNRYILN